MPPAEGLMNISHILVAADLSTEAMSCIPSVAGLARSLSARITLLHVVESCEAIPHGSPLAPPLRAPGDRKAIDAAREQLEQRRSAFGADVQVTLELIDGGDPAEEIVAYACGHLLSRFES